MRADARANRSAIIAAARELYATHGPEVTFSAIAEHAGVGSGTLYRHFPTRNDLAIGVVEWLSETVEEVCARWLGPMTEDPEGSWTGFVGEMVQLRTAAFMPQLVQGIDAVDLLPQITARRDAAVTAIESVIDLAKGAGLVRADVAPMQFQLGLAVATRPLPDVTSTLLPDIEAWLVEVYLRGLRPDHRE